MEKQNSELRSEARKSLKGKWLPGVLMSLVLATAAVLTGLIPFVSFAFNLLILPVMCYGVTIAFLRCFRGEKFSVGTMFIGFKSYNRVLTTMLLKYARIVLWSLLGVIPGIVKSYSYAMTPYLLHDYPEFSADEVLSESEKMMDGFKMRLFMLDLSFFGWGLLCVLTLGIGFLWLIPYIKATRVAFYEDVRDYAYVYVPEYQHVTVENANVCCFAYAI